MGAAKNSAACAQVVTNQVLSVAQVAAFVATAWAGGEGGMAVMAGRDVAAGASDVKALENVSSAAADARALEKGLEEGSAATKSASFTAKVKSGYNYAKTSQDAAWKKIAAASNCLQQIERAAGTISDFNQSSDPYVRAMANPALATDAAVISCLASIAGLNAKAPTAAEQSAANAAALKGETVFSAEQIANLKASATLAGVRALSRSAQVQKTAIERMQDTTVKAEAAKPTDTWTAEDYTRTAALMASVVDPTGVSATVAA